MPPSQELAMKLLSKNEVKAITLYSHAHRARLEAVGKFPKRLRLSDNPRGRCGYLEHEIQEWLAQRLKTRHSHDSSQ